MRRLALVAALAAGPAFAQEAAPSAPAPATEPAPAPATEPAPAPATEPAPAPATEPAPAPAPAPDPNAVARVRVEQGPGGLRLMVNERPFMVFGMNWDLIPIGENYAYDFWGKPPEFIKTALEREMGLLKRMGVNVIRQATGIPPEWVTYIHDTYGIYTIVNHTVGRYGMLVNGAWLANTDYADPETRAALKAEVAAMVAQYRDTRGMLMWLLGNENNYGLHWTSFEAENLPTEQQDTARAAPLYSIMGELIDEIHAADPHRRPVSIANGDLGYIDLIAKHCPNLDVLGTNVYRGASARDLFEVVKAKLGKPVMFTEFGSDAYDARAMREDPLMQAYYLHGQWQEIYEQSAGKGREGNAIGGLIFQWSDGWWKHLQQEGLDKHDTIATWSNGGYPLDLTPGANNINEEWFGITAKDPPDASGQYTLRPRAAYYLLAAAFKLDPYADTTTLEAIRKHFGALAPRDFLAPYLADRADARLDEVERFRVSRLRLELETFTSVGSPQTARGTDTQFDHLESMYLGVETRPAPGIWGEVVVNVLGNVPTNRLDEIFYENRGERVTVQGEAGKPVELDGLDRVAIHSAEFKIEERWFEAHGFYRVGHGQWGYEGDFFGLYPEAYYGPNLDRYHGMAPSGVEFTGRLGAEGFKLAFGPELYWGANPAVIAKYRRILGPVTVTAVHQEDLASKSRTESTTAVPERRTRRTTLHGEFATGGLKLELGGLFAGSDRVGLGYRWTRETDGRGYQDSGLDLLADEVAWADTLGGKAKLSLTAGRYNLYVQGAYKGLVADAGPDQTLTFAGWMLKESGRGNQWNTLGGLLVHMAPFQVGINGLYQRPLVGPLPTLGDHMSDATGIYYAGVGPRNTRDDPFAVLDNREQAAAELLLVYDPTPNTWFWAWDNDLREDAAFAASLDGVYRHRYTTRDSMFYVSKDGQFLPFGAAPRRHDTWDAVARFVSRPGGAWRIIGHAAVGQGEASGAKSRALVRNSESLALQWNGWRVENTVKFDDWGPYDYHRDFDLTYPFQWYGDLSWSALSGLLGEAYARFGVRGEYRTLDDQSTGFRVETPAPGATAHEWEFSTYMHLGM
jgi:beta-galactosidase